jgi:hypothetical protein
MTLAEIKAQVEAAKLAQAAKRADKLEEIKLTAELRKLTDPQLQARKEKLEYQGDIMDTIAAKIELAKQAVQDLEVTNKKGEQIQYNTYGLQGYGKVFELVTGMVSGLIYNREDVRTEAATVLGLSRPLVEALISNYLVTPKWDSREATINVGQRANIVEFLSLLDILSDELGVSEIPLTKVPTQAELDEIYDNAMTKAESDKLDHEAAVLKWEADNAPLEQRLANAHLS